MIKVMDNKKPNNPRMTNPDGMYASEARSEDFFSLRDHFAGLAMQAMISGEHPSSVWSEEASKQAFYIADTMLSAREQEEM